jgi:hypothetical protein
VRRAAVETLEEPRDVQSVCRCSTDEAGTRDKIYRSRARSKVSFPDVMRHYRIFGHRLDDRRRGCVFADMNRIALVLVLLILVVSCEGRSPTDPSGGWARLSGVVTNPYGSVWGGVTVSIVNANGAVVATSMSDQRGRYSLTVRPPGHYRVWLQLGRTGPGYFVGEIDLRVGRNSFNIVS